MKQVLLIGLVLTLSIACDDGTTLHPTKINLEAADGYLDLKASEQNQRLLSLRDQLLNKTFRSSLADEKLLGTIADIELDDEGYAYVLDQDQKQIFKIKDSQIDILGREGQGPGEMGFPISLDYHDNKLYVSDFMRGVLVIDIHDSDENNDFPYRFAARDAKATPNGVYILQGMIAQANPDGELKTIDYYDNAADSITKRFDSAYIDDNRVAVRRLSAGNIEYVHETDLLISMKYHSPIITAYKNGELEWQKKFRDMVHFQMTEFINPAPGGIRNHRRFTEDKEEFHDMKTLQSAGDGILIVQFLHAALNPEEEIIKPLTTYLIDTRDGSTLKMDDYPRIMALRNNYLITQEKNTTVNYNLYSY